MIHDFYCWPIELLLAHRDPDQIRRLVTRPRHRAVDFHVHVDRNSNIAPFVSELRGLGDEVPLLPARYRHPTPWGDIGPVRATIDMVRLCRAEHDGGHCMLLSGQGYPRRSNEKIVEHFETNRTINFIEAFELLSELWPNHGLDRIESTDREYGSRVRIESTDREYGSRVRIESTDREYGSRVRIESTR